MAGWQESEVIANLFVGDLQDAQRFDGMIINVLPDLLEGEPAHAIHMPFLAEGLETLERTADLSITASRMDSGCWCIARKGANARRW